MPVRSNISRRHSLMPWASSLAVCVVLLLALGSSAARAANLQEIRFWSLGEITRVVVQVDGEFSYKWNRLSDPPRAFFDLPGVDLSLVRDGKDRGRVRHIAVDDALLKQIRYAEYSAGVARVVLDLNEDCTITTSQLANPARLVIELRTRKAPAPGIHTSRTGTATENTTASSAPEPTPVAPQQAPRPSVAVSPSSAITVPSANVEGAREVAVAAAPVQGAPAQQEPARLKPAATPSAAPTTPQAAVISTASERATATTPAEGTTIATTKRPSSAEIAPAEKEEDPAALAKPASRTVSGRQSLVRALGLKIGRVVIDPGHGGQDHGTTGAKGLREKDVVLDISLRLAKLVREKLGSEVVLTREEDHFIPLEERTAIANRHRADLFISVHANSSPYKLASGPETFFLNLTNSREAMDVASRENASSQRSVADLQDIVRKIALKDKRDESEDFAAKVQTALFRAQRKAGTATKNRGVKSAPFVVLIGAEMPSILVEIGFLSNAKEEARLKTPAYRQKLAEALLEGLEKYMDSLSHFEGKERASRE